MTRKKVKLAFIENNTKRRATYRKRKKGLLNKMSALSTLCGVDACAIIYSPDDPKPDVWPNSLGAQHVISQYKCIPEMDKSNKMLNQETFLRQSIAKIYGKLNKQRSENRDIEITELMFQSLLIGKRRLQNLALPDLNDLRGKVEQNLKEINNRIEFMRNMPAQRVAPPNLLPHPPSPATPFVTNNQMQPTGMQVQEQNHLPQRLGDWFNHPIENMGFDQGEEDQIITCLANNPTTVWPSASYDQGSTRPKIL